MNMQTPGRGSGGYMLPRTPRPHTPLPPAPTAATQPPPHTQQRTPRTHTALHCTAPHCTAHTHTPEGFPDDALADVGGDEERDGGAQAPPVVQHLVQKQHQDARDQQLRDDQHAVDQPDVGGLAVHAGQHVHDGLPHGDDQAQHVLRGLPAQNAVGGAGWVGWGQGEPNECVGAGSGWSAWTALACAPSNEPALQAQKMLASHSVSIPPTHSPPPPPPAPRPPAAHEVAVLLDRRVDIQQLGADE